MKIERRGNRQGPTHRITMSFTQSTYEALRAQSEKLGYSIAGIARQVIDRGVAAGLLSADTPSTQGAAVVRVTQDERYRQLQDEQVRLLERIVQQKDEQIEILHDRLDLNVQMVSHLHRGLDDYTEIITQQARDIEFYEHARVHAVDDAERIDG